MLIVTVFAHNAQIFVQLVYRQIIVHLAPQATSCSKECAKCVAWQTVSAARIQEYQTVALSAEMDIS